MAGPQARLTNLVIFPNGIRTVLNEPAAHQAMLTIGKAVAAEVRTIVPRSLRTRQNASGDPHKHLVDHLSVMTRSLGGVAAVIVLADVPHAMAYHNGANPHPILARNPKKVMLKFFWKKAGKTFIGPEVNHPGSQGHPFFGIACARLGLTFKYGPTAGVLTIGA